MTQEKMKPYGKLGIIALESCKDLGAQIDKKIVETRSKFLTSAEIENESFLVHADEIRFSNGEGKVQLVDTVRGKDIYILCDVSNYGCTYNMFGVQNHKGPDEHFQDIVRTLSAISGKSRRTTVIMPLLYASRQHKRRGRESMDCAIALQQLAHMGVKDIISFDVHDPSIQNAIPIVSFENIYASYEIVKTMLNTEPDVLLDKSRLLIISPDTGAMDRAIYYAGVLGVDVGLFYKRRDHSVVVNGKNPIVAHEYIGRDLEGQNIVIIDDMIASGESIFDIATELRKRKANKIYAAVTFALFTEGIQKFDKYYEDGLIDKVYATNLNYIPEEIKEKEWFQIVDCSGLLAQLIDHLNYDRSIAPLIETTAEIAQLIQTYIKKGD